MRVLLITGQLARQALYESAAQQKSVQFSVRALPVPVAALLTPSRIAEELKSEDLGNYDLVIIPGMVRGDASTIEKAVRVPVFKGTRYAADIPMLLGALDSVKLSKVEAADSILSQHSQLRSKTILEEVERIDMTALGKPGHMMIGKSEGNCVQIGRDFPMRVIAEILDAPILSDEDILRKAKHYVQSGARIVDVGMLADETRPDDVKRAVSMLKRKLTIPISIDTISPEEIEEALFSGVDMILSVNSQNLGKVNCPASSDQVAVVVTPERSETVEARVTSLEENIKKAAEIGFKKIIADPIMDPLVFPGTVTSIIAAHSFSKRNPVIPLMAGVGNITELIDADSIGVNAIMAGIAQEMGVNLLLTTEGSVKTEGTIKELVAACNMMYLAERRKAPPKDLGVDLLVLKEKRRRELYYDANIETRGKKPKVLSAKRGPEPEIDPRGFFKVNVDRKKNEIIVTHFERKGEAADVIVKGIDPLAIRDTLLKSDLVSTLEHAFYLGMETEKAHVASQINRSYYQDDELFQ
nr:dihydropteroate synthase-like protein [Candidatus Njordarchaeota archaeon]